MHTHTDTDTHTHTHTHTATEGGRDYFERTIVSAYARTHMLTLNTNNILYIDNTSATVIQFVKRSLYCQLNIYSPSSA